MLTVGIDLGGTNIKAAVVNSSNTILAEATRPTGRKRPPQQVCADMAACMQRAVQGAGLTPAEISGVGIGCPGTIDPAAGIVRYSNNLGWKEFDLRSCFEKATGFSPALGNDANVAALGEAVAGCAKGAQSAIIVTLGTGVGGGVVLNGEIYTGYGGGASELGHMVLETRGPKCTCGRRGCFEVYSSATGLKRMTRRAVKKHPQSSLALLAEKTGFITGRQPFDAQRAGCPVGTAVVDEYLSYLAAGLTNLVNIFQPEVIALSGGVSKEGEALLTPLQEKVNASIFGGPGPRPTRLAICSLGHRAGLVGAAALARQQLV